MHAEMKCHYLAQCYLNAFATKGDDPPAIWQYKKSTSELRKRGVKKIAQRTDYYVRTRGDERDESIEAFFSKVESRWKEARRMLSRFAESASMPHGNDAPVPTIDELIFLLHFMFIHPLRAPNSMERVRADLTDDLPAGMSHEAVNNIMLESMIGFHDRHASAFVKSHIGKPLCVYVAPAGARSTVLTSDNPVLMYRTSDDGVAHDLFDEAGSVVFPASRRVAVGFKPLDDSTPVHTKMLGNADELDQLNGLAIKHAVDEVYAYEPDYLERLLTDMGRTVKRLEPAR